MSAEIIDGRAIADKVIREVRDEVDKLSSEVSIRPGLAVVLIGDDRASATYVATKEKAAREAGINTATFKLPELVSEKELLDLIRQLNTSPLFHGILVQFPIPKQLNAQKVLSAIDVLKDVEGLNPTNAGLLLEGAPRIVPCVPAGIRRMLVEIGRCSDGQRVVICGRSLIAGRPTLASFLGTDPHADVAVTVCDLNTTNLSGMTREADILIVALGKPRAITAQMVKDGAVVIDVGVHRVEDSTKKSGYRLVGDVDFDSVKEKARAITPVPGGVGPMTVAMLLYNTVKAARIAAGREYG